MASTGTPVWLEEIRAYWAAINQGLLEDEGAAGAEQSVPASPGADAGLPDLETPVAPSSRVLPAA